jgi:hypothetical protein
MLRMSGARFPNRTSWDWRAWIALLWALWWGWAYILMVVHARSPQILAWLRMM